MFSDFRQSKDRVISLQPTKQKNQPICSEDYKTQTTILRDPELRRELDKRMSGATTAGRGSPGNRGAATN
jgi:hypothetical protein